MTRRKYWLVLDLVLAGLGLLAAWACIKRPMQLPMPESTSVQSFVMPQSAQRDLDLLFMVDDSRSMENEQRTLASKFQVLMDTLKHMRGGLPNVHIGVVTSDLGSGPYTERTGCGLLGGDKGILGRAMGQDLGERFIGPGQRYIVDVEPKGCHIERTVLPNGVQCTSNDCTQENCELARTQGSNENLSLYVDPETGCPRCRNYDGELSAVFANYAHVGDKGCGFEQQLEAVKKALDRSDPDTAVANQGFLREDAYLGVIWVTDEDDCSASKPDVLFNPDPAQSTLESVLGPLKSFRCFEFGIACDVDGHTVTGPRTNCVPRSADDPKNYLFPVNRYTSFLESLKDPDMMVVAAIAAPVPDVVNVVTKTDRSGTFLALDFSCHDPVNPDEGGKPGIRMKAVVSYFNSEADMNSWAYTSICAEDYSSALQGIGRKLVEAMSEKCLSQPFSGCVDGPSGTSCSPCYPKCEVTVTVHRGLPDEQVKSVPWCGHVCQDGLCTPDKLQDCAYDDNGKCTCPSGTWPTVLTDASGNPVEGCAPLKYPNAVPNASPDPTLAEVLPETADRASACWYLSSETSCTLETDSGEQVPAKAGFRVVWAKDPPPRTFVKAACETVTPTEQLCSDGQDNDQDCKIDFEDEDCQTSN